jgi:glycerol-3-phosphate dehydrogenase
LIGTTDRDYKGDPGLVIASDEEISYLCAAASEYFEKPIQTSDIIWTYSGVRPLYDDGASKAQEATRDYVLKLDAPEGEAALLSIFGGKITTYRRLAEAALEKLSSYLPGNSENQRGWTGKKMLPGGDFDRNGFSGLVESLSQKHPRIRKALIRRLVRSYGTRAALIFSNAESESDLGAFFGDTLSEAEVRYLITHEWVITAHDVLWRRSKLGLRLTKDQVQKLEDFIASELAHSV